MLGGGGPEADRRPLRPQPSVEQAADDEHFARYEDAPRRGGGFVQSLAFGLILTGLGMAFALLFILLYGIHV